jgi:hypothetical protein
MPHGTRVEPGWPGRLLMVMLLAVAVSGCAHQPPSALPGVPGFFSGLLHGLLILVSLVGSIFTDVRVYAFPNSGFFYDLGFVIGASAILGGGAHTARRR